MTVMRFDAYDVNETIPRIPKRYVKDAQELMVSQGTAYDVNQRVSLLFATINRHNIKFPTTETQKIANRTMFQNLGRNREYNGIPGIDDDFIYLQDTAI